MITKDFDKIGCREDYSRYTKYFICPICNKLTSIDGYFVNYFKVPKENTKIKVLNPEIQCYCDDCKEYMYECDKLLTDSVIKFNKSGFRTEFCCEGHYENGLAGEYSIPYLKFSDSMDEHNWYIITNTLYSAILYNKWKEYFQINHIERFIDILETKHPIDIMNNDRQIHLNWILADTDMTRQEFEQFKFYFCTVINQVAFILYEG